MSDNDDRDSGKVGAFLMGFLVGVFVCLGAGGTFALVQGRQMQMREMMAREEAMMAAEMAREAEMQARAEKERAEKLLREAKEKKDKPKE